MTLPHSAERESTRIEAAQRDLAGQSSFNAPDAEPKGRPLGSPLPQGKNGKEPVSAPMAPVGRPLNTDPANDEASGFQRAFHAFKQAMPFVQRLLPLVDGNVAGALVNLLAARASAPAHAAKVDLAPIENRLVEMQVQHGDLRTQFQEQNTTLKRVEDQLEMVREATDRNTLEQQELMEDLRSMSHKVNLLAYLLAILLLGSVLINLALFLHIRRVLP